MVNQKKKIIILGGKPFNIPKELAAGYDIVRHIEQDVEKIQSLPLVDAVVIFSKWVNHRMVDRVKVLLKEVPLVSVKSGWVSIKAELERRGFKPVFDSPDGNGIPPAPADDDSSITESEVRDTAKAIEDLVVEFGVLEHDRDEAVKSREILVEELKVVKEQISSADRRLNEIRPIIKTVKDLSRTIKEVKGE